MSSLICFLKLGITVRDEQREDRNRRIAEGVRRSWADPVVRARRTQAIQQAFDGKHYPVPPYCGNGHALTDENLYFPPDSKKTWECRRCKSATHRRRRRRLRTEREAGSQH